VKDAIETNLITYKPTDTLFMSLPLTDTGDVCTNWIYVYRVWIDY